MLHVTGAKTRQICGPYSGCASPRLWRKVAIAALLAIPLGGCSLSGQLDSFFPSSDKSDRTGTVASSSAKEDAQQLPPPADLAYARAAASAVLSRGEKDSSMPWENPRTGTRGTVTPIASAYTQDGQTCRDFLASFVSGSSQSWVQGEACKQQQGDWQVRSFKPWKRS